MPRIKRNGHSPLQHAGPISHPPNVRWSVLACDGTTQQHTRQSCKNVLRCKRRDARSAQFWQTLLPPSIASFRSARTAPANTPIHCTQAAAGRPGIREEEEVCQCSSHYRACFKLLPNYLNPAREAWQCPSQRHHSLTLLQSHALAVSRSCSQSTHHSTVSSHH